MKKLGFIVNPFAGIGGSVALKGSDGDEIVEKALALGAVQKAPTRAVQALEELKPYKDSFVLITCHGDMGENEAVAAGFDPQIIGDELGERTKAQDTCNAALKMEEENVDLILFAGGDGTARDIYDTIGTRIPVVGIPAGTKMHSAIYASSPKAAGSLCAMYLNDIVKKTTELEVMDIDEDAFREGKVIAKLYGALKVPNEPNLTQGMKSGGHASDDSAYLDGISDYVVDDMKEDTLYIIGSGTTCQPVMDKLGLENTLLGVDVVQNKRLLAKDVTENQLKEIVKDKKAIIYVTPIGGQGYIFGRGNQQLSGEVIRMVGTDNVRIIATPSKINSLPKHQLRVDTGDVEVDEMLKGPKRVICNRAEISILDIV